MPIANCKVNQMVLLVKNLVIGLNHDKN